MEIGDGEYSFNTIYLYIILKLLALPTRLFLVLIPYIFTSFSNLKFKNNMPSSA